MSSFLMVWMLMFYLAFAASEQFDVTTIYRFQKTSFIYKGFKESSSSYDIFPIQECSVNDCPWETYGLTEINIRDELVPPAAVGYEHLSASSQSNAVNLNLYSIFTIAIKIPEYEGFPMLLFFLSNSNMFVIIFDSDNEVGMYKCTNGVTYETELWYITNYCSRLYSQHFDRHFFKRSKLNYLKFDISNLRVMKIIALNLYRSEVEFLMDDVVAEFNFYGARHHNSPIDSHIWKGVFPNYEIFKLSEKEAAFTSQWYDEGGHVSYALCLAVEYYFEPEANGSIAVKMVPMYGNEESIVNEVVAWNSKDYAWKTHVFYNDNVLSNKRIKLIIEKPTNDSLMLIKNIRQCKPEDNALPLTIVRDSSVEVHSRNNALGLPLISPSGKVLDANVAVDFEPCTAIEDGCNWELTDYEMIKDSSPLTLPGEEQVFSPTKAGASMVSQKFIPKNKKICVSLVSYDQTSSCKLQILKMDGHILDLAQKQETSLGEGWKVKVYHGETTSILGPISIKLSECSFNYISSARIQRIAGCNSEDLDDDIHIVSSSKNSSYLDYLTYDVAVKDSSPANPDTENCLNGGLYDERRSSCICPPGFMGSSCEIGCGPDRYGSRCDARCSKTKLGCMEMKLCRPKIGCSCAAGIKGIVCDIPCSKGQYGAGCKQFCGNCDFGDCDKYTGICFQGCQDGFYAPYCHLRYKYLQMAPQVEAIDFYTLQVSYSLNPKSMQGVGKPRFHQLQIQSGAWSEWKELLPIVLNNEDTFETNITNLTPNMKYKIRAVLLDDDGNSYQRGDVPITELSTKCKVPDEMNYNLTLMFVTDDTFTVEWQYDSDITWCTFSHFEIELKMGWKWQHVSNTETTSFKFQGMLPAETYQIRVRAMTVKGAVAFSEAFTVITEDEAPEAVTALKVVSKTHSELELEWKEPFSKRGKIQGYSVSYRCVKLLGCSSMYCRDIEGKMDVLEPSVSLHGLQSHAQYEIRISAKAAKYGAIASLLVATDMTVPEVAPSAEPNSVVSSNSTLMVKWKYPENCTSINGYLFGFIYELYKSGSPSPIRQGKTQETWTSFAGLTPHTHYTIKVYLNTSGGKNLNQALAINASTKGSVPGQVQQLSVYKTGRRVLGLRWAEPREAYGKIHSFTITYRAKDQKATTVVIKPTPCFAWPDLFCYTINYLKQDMEYVIQVQARNTEVPEDGEISEVVAITKENAPLAPGYIRAVAQTETELTIQWGLPRMLNGVLRSFLVNVEETDSHNISSCCTDFPIEEIPARSEQAFYQKQLNNLKPASTYTVSVAAKTTAMGPAVSITTHTRPAVPSVGSLQVADSDEGISGSPSLIIQPVSENKDIVSGYLIVVLPKSTKDNIQEPTFHDDWIAQQLKQRINGTFYVAAQLDQENLEEESEVLVGSGENIKNGKWCEIHDPILQDGQQYNFGLVTIFDYCGVFNIGYTEIGVFKVEF